MLYIGTRHCHDILECNYHDTGEEDRVCCNPYLCNGVFVFSFSLFSLLASER
jgi:hypothetical protein